MTRLDRRPTGKRHTRSFPPWRPLALVSALVVLSAGCVHYDLPRALRRAPGAATMGVELSNSRGGYRVTSVTRLNGRAKLSEKPTVRIASGSDANWLWAVKAVPSAAPELRARLASQETEKIRRQNARSGSRTHAAVGWGLVFRRAHRVARYLLGHHPPALHATVLLLPPGVKYFRAITRTGRRYLPLTLAFSWPRSNRLEESASLVHAVASTVYEYQHLLVDSKIIPTVGKTRGDREANDEARSHCWSQATFLALESGTKAYVEYKVFRSRAPVARAMSEESMPKLTARDEVRVLAWAPGREPRIRFSDGWAWGTFFEVKSLASYLQQRGIPDLKVVADKPTQMNAVLSVCRAMTQHPLDLTATDGYPPSKVKFVPFFPTSLKVPKLTVAHGGK